MKKTVYSQDQEICCYPKPSFQWYKDKEKGGRKLSAIHKGHGRLCLFLSYCLIYEAQSVAISSLQLAIVFLKLCELTEITLSLLPSLASHDSDSQVQCRVSACCDVIPNSTFYLKHDFLYIIEELKQTNL